MVPSAFDEDNAVLNPPLAVKDAIACLSVFKGFSQTGLPLTVSCWRPTPQEWAEMRKTGRVWLIVLGETMPPVALSGVYPFDRE